MFVYCDSRVVMKINWQSISEECRDIIYDRRALIRLATVPTILKNGLIAGFQSGTDVHL